MTIIIKLYANKESDPTLLKKILNRIDYVTSLKNTVKYKRIVFAHWYPTINLLPIGPIKTLIGQIHTGDNFMTVYEESNDFLLCLERAINNQFYRVKAFPGLILLDSYVKVYFSN